MSGPNLEGKRFAVVGLGKSGRAAARLLAGRGAEVLANDSRTEAQLVDAAAEMREAGVGLALGGHDLQQLSSMDHIVVSPGVPRLRELDEAEASGVPISSEVELASWFFKGRVVAITGTNGKSTVTSMLGAMASHDDVPLFVGGNLGTPLTDAVDTPAAGSDGLIVVELSSYQLERVSTFRANVAVLLNVSDDHLDRYDSFAGYAAAKGRIFAGQKRADHAVVPAGDALCESLARAGAAKVVRFGAGAAVAVRERDGRRILCDERSELNIPVDELRIVGSHNLSNAAAAVVAAQAAGLSGDAIEAGLRGFSGLPHRMEYVAERSGVRFYDDSKATNVGATVAALRGFEHEVGKVVLIAGGRDKGGTYEPMVQALSEVGRSVVVIGEAASVIENAVGDVVPLSRATTMDEAVRIAFDMAQKGDSVLLAPACSSFDMYRSFAFRGEAFVSAVHALQGEGGKS